MGARVNHRAHSSVGPLVKGFVWIPGLQDVWNTKNDSALVWAKSQHGRSFCFFLRKWLGEVDGLGQGHGTPTTGRRSRGLGHRYPPDEGWARPPVAARPRYGPVSRGTLQYRLNGSPNRIKRMNIMARCLLKSGLFMGGLEKRLWIEIHRLPVLCWVSFASSVASFFGLFWLFSCSFFFL